MRGEGGGHVGEHNRALRAARERLPSRRVPGEPLSRGELADAVNAHLWQTTGVRYELDDHLVGKWERGVVRWPIAPYRAALRAVLGVDTDAELGFQAPGRRPHRGAVAAPDPDPHAAVAAWQRSGIVAEATGATEWELINRRNAVRGAAVLGGAALLGPLAGWLEPLVGGALSARRGPFAVAEVEALERLAATFREWRSAGAGLGRAAVVGQLAEVAERLDGAPDGPLTDRGFLVAAELARIAGSMAFDAGQHATAQRHYVTAVRLAKAGGHESFGAVALAAIARQAFDLGAPNDGLEVIALAQHGTRHSATPALRAMLATRQAWGHAQRGEGHAFERAVGDAEQAHADVAPENEPRWLHGLDRAELAGTIGARYRDLARHDRRHAPRAVSYLGRALSLRNPARARNRAFDLVSLARVHLLTGEHDHAAATVRQALPLVDVNRPGRLARKLGDWHREAAPFASVPAVRDTRRDIADVTAAAV